MRPHDAHQRPPRTRRTHPGDLATLIDTFQEQKLMRVRTKKGNYCRTMRVNDNRVMYDTVPFPTINVDKLIDYAASRMSVS